MDLEWGQFHYVINLGIVDSHRMTFDLPPMKKPQVSYGD